VTLADYTELQAAVGDWLNRADLAAQIPDFIALAEATIRRRLRRTKIRATVTFTAASFPLPSDCAELSSARLVTGIPGQDVPLRIVTETALAEYRAATGSNSGRPIAASVIGPGLLLVPAPDTNYSAEIIYFSKLVSLSDAQPTNALLTEAPDLYLNGALVQASKFLEHDERIPVWTQSFQDAIDELNLVREREELGAAPRRQRSAVVFG
jgi:hypothetical protein